MNRTVTIEIKNTDPSSGKSVQLFGSKIDADDVDMNDIDDFAEHMAKKTISANSSATGIFPDTIPSESKEDQVFLTAHLENRTNTHKSMKLFHYEWGDLCSDDQHCEDGYWSVSEGDYGIWFEEMDNTFAFRVFNSFRFDVKSCRVKRVLGDFPQSISHKRKWFSEENGRLVFLNNNISPTQMQADLIEIKDTGLIDKLVGFPFFLEIPMEPYSSIMIKMTLDPNNE